MPNARGLTEMGLNTAMMFAFAVPGGEVVGAALAVAEFLVGLLWQDQPVPPEEQPVTVAAFNAALDDLKGEIRAILTDAKLQDDTSLILALTKTLQANWAAALSVRTTSDTLNNFEAYDFIQDNTTALFVQNLHDYFTKDDTLGTAAGKLNSVMIDPAATDAIATQNKTFGLFMLLGSLTAGYLKAAVAWEWGNEILGVRTWNAYGIAETAWKKNPDPNHPELEPIAPAKSVQAIPSWQDWRAEPGSRVDELIDQIDVLMTYAEDRRGSKGVYTAMARNWQDRQTKTTGRVQQISITGGGLSVTDAQTKNTYGPFATAARATAVMQAMVGSQLAYEWQYWTRQGRLDLVEGSDIPVYGQTIAEWKKIFDSVKFKTHIWQTTDTIETVAALIYTDADRGDRIVAANWSQLPSAKTPLTAGMNLIIPGLIGGVETPYTVKAGDTIDSVGHAFYPDALLANFLVDFNKDKLTANPPPAFAEGTVLKCPDLS